MMGSTLAKGALCFLLLSSKCDARTVQDHSPPRRCVGHIVRQFSEGLVSSSSRSSILQKLHDVTVCETCTTTGEAPEETSTTEAQYHAVIFVAESSSASLNDNDSGLLTIAGELLQEGFRVTVLYVYLGKLNEAGKEADVVLKRRILSSLPCEVEAALSHHLSVRSAAVTEQLASVNGGPFSPPSPCNMPNQLYSSPYDSCALELAEPISQILQSLIEIEDLPDIIVLNASLLGGLLLAEQLKIATIALAPPQLLDLLTEKEDERLAAMRKTYVGGFRSLIRSRLNSFALSGPFVRLNQIRKTLGLNPIRNPADCFNSASAIIVNTSPQLELYRRIPDHVHLVGPLLPQCVPCSYHSEQVLPHSILDIGMKSVTDAITLTILPMDLSLKQSRSLLRGLSFARAAMQSYATEVCKQLEMSSDESCGLMGKMLSFANETELQSLAEKACKKQNMLWEKQCNRSLAMSRFNVVWLQRDGKVAQVPQVLPLFVSLEKTPLTDSAARHPQTDIVVSQCEGSDSQEALLLGVPIMCVPTTGAQVESTLQLMTTAAKYGAVRVNLSPKDIAKELLGMLLSIQFERMREDLTTMEVNHVFDVSLQTVNPFGGARAAGNMLGSAGGVQRAIEIVREAAFIQRRSPASSTWQTRLFLSLQFGRTRRHVNEPGSYAVFVAWFILVMAVLFLANTWTLLPTWLVRGLRQQLPQQYPSQFAHVGKAKIRLFAWLKSLDLVTDEESQNHLTRGESNDVGLSGNRQAQHPMRRDGTSTNLRRRRTARRR